MSDIIASYTEYTLAVPDYFLNYLSQELIKRDISGLTAGRIQGIIPTSEHPMVQLTGAVLSGKSQPDFAGILPAISVVEADETEESTTVSHGSRGWVAINQQFIDDLKAAYPTMKDRVPEGLVTDSQLDTMGQTVSNLGGDILGEVHEYWQRESVFISLWAHNLQERQVLGRLLRSIVYKMRLDMTSRGVVDITIRISKGLVNFNFGRVLYGMEIEITFLNKFTNMDVLNERVLDTSLPVVTIGIVSDTSGYVGAGTDDEPISVYSDFEEE
jgi:hypothetical protein